VQAAAAAEQKQVRIAMVLLRGEEKSKGRR
jgi:hypothetical protein